MNLIDRLRRGGGGRDELTGDRLIHLVEKGEIEALVEGLRDRPEPRRRELGAALLTYLRGQRDRWWRDSSVTAVAVVAVGCLPTAAQAAALLGRSQLRWSWNSIPADPVLRAAADRQIGWVGDFAVRMAGKLDRDMVAGGWEFVAALLLATDTPPPTDDRFVQGWISHMGWPADERLRKLPAVDRLRADPYLDVMVPRLFEVDGLGLAILGPDWSAPDAQVRREPALILALATLAEQQRLDRAALIDGCLARFLRGDRPNALRAFVRLHEALAPNAAEVVTRAADYARLLSDAPSPVATLAQRMLRAASDTGGVEPELVLDAGRAVLGRPEKALVRAQLSWLDTIARRDAARADEVLDVVATAFAHPAVDVQERALSVTAKHLRSAGPAARTGLRQAAEDLTADLRPRAADLFGDDAPAGGTTSATTDVTGGQPGSPDVLPAPPSRAPMPPPIESADELAEELAALCTGSINSISLERLLEALVRLSATARPALRTALRPVIDRNAELLNGYDWGEPGWMFGALGAAVRVAAGVRTHSREWGSLLHALRDPITHSPISLPAGRLSPSPHRFLLTRVAEVALRLDHRPVPALVATPTLGCGLLEPAVLHERLARAEREDWQPLPFDLTQAMVRLPRTIDPAVIATAGTLRSTAGTTFARWLATGGLPDARITGVEVPGPSGTSWRWYGPLPQRRVQLVLAPPAGFDDPIGFLTLPAPAQLDNHPGRLGMPTLWPAVLPAHPDVVAAHALPQIAATADVDQRGGAEVLPLLAESAGPAGPAVCVALAYGLAARHEGDRVAAIDALLAFAAADNLPAEAVGDALGRLAAGKLIKLTRAVQALTDVVRSGAPTTAWRVISAALPALLAATPVPRGLPDLLTLAAQAAAATGPAGVGLTIAGLARVAEGTGTNRLVTEARRLARVLSP